MLKKRLIVRNQNLTFSQRLYEERRVKSNLFAFTIYKYLRHLRANCDVSYIFEDKLTKYKSS